MTPRPSYRTVPGARLILLLLALLLLTRPALATSVGTIFSGPTSKDGAIVYWNPAGMTRMDGTHVMLFGGASLIQIQHQRATPSAFDGTLYPEATIALFKPNLALGIVTDAGLSGLPASPLNDVLKDFRFGVGLSLPIIEGASWEDTYAGRPASTRYYSGFSYQALLYIELALAYRINRYISVGVGLDVIGALVTNSMAVDLGAKVNQTICSVAGSNKCPLGAPLQRENPAYDGQVQVDGTGWGTGGVFSVLLSLPPLLHAGLAFHTGAGIIPVPIVIDVELPPALMSYMKQNLPSIALPVLHAEAEIGFVSPMIITAGAAVTPLPELEVAFDLQWIDYSASTEMLVYISSTTTALIRDQVLVKTKKDGFVMGLRGAYQLLDELRLALRLELSTNTRPEAFVTPVSMDFHIVSLQLGAGWQATSWLYLTLEYGHYFLVSRTIENSHFAPRASPATSLEEGFDLPSPVGTYTGMADSLSLGVHLEF